MIEETSDQTAADHLMPRGAGKCGTRVPLPPGKFSADVPRDASFYCKTCVFGHYCAAAENGEQEVEFEDILSASLDDDDETDDDSHLPRPWGY